MDINLSPDHDRSTTRVSQACQRCRSLKARCLRSEQDGVCQRCYKSRRECTWTDAQQRMRRTRAPSRISQVERKIDGLVARITERLEPVEPEYPSPATTATTSSGETQTPAACFDQASERQAFVISNHVQNDSGDDEEAEPRISLPDLSTVHSFADLPQNPRPEAQKLKSRDESLRRSILNHPDAEILLEEYRTMAPSFPFVPVSPDTSIEKLRSERPMLLFAIMTAACWRNRAFQKVLEKRFRQEVALRTLVCPAKDLTLLQSILVYLAWYHHYLDYSMENGASLPHLCMSLTIELRLDPATKIHLLGGSKDSTSSNKSGTELREEQRTLLGCYFLCSCIASGAQKPNIFKRTKYIFESAHELAGDHEFESDLLLPSLVESRHIDDDIFNTFHGETPLMEIELGAQVMSWQTKLQVWKDEINHTDRRLLSLTGFHSIEMNLYLALVHTPYSTDQSLNLTAMLDACKAHLDKLMSTPTEVFHLLSFPEWIMLPHVIMTLTTLCIPSSTHPIDWDAKSAQDRVRLDLYLESLCFRMQSRSTYRPPSQPNIDYWIALKTVLVSVGRWYKKTAEAAGSRAVPFRCPGRFLAKRMGATGTAASTLTSSAPVETPHTGDMSVDLGLGSEDMDLFANMDLWAVDPQDFTTLMNADLNF